MDFEWDADKARSNLEKHGVSSELARRTFDDALRGERPSDEDAADGEDRWVTTGLVAGVELIVVYTVREDKLRLIPARKADRHEREEYWKNR